MDYFSGACLSCLQRLSVVYSRVQSCGVSEGYIWSLWAPAGWVHIDESSHRRLVSQPEPSYCQESAAPQTSWNRNKVQVVISLQSLIRSKSLNSILKVSLVLLKLFFKNMYYSLFFIKKHIVTHKQQYVVTAKATYDAKANCRDLCLLCFFCLVSGLSLLRRFPQFPPACSLTPLSHLCSLMLSCTHSPIALPTVFSLLEVSQHLSDPLFSSCVAVYCSVLFPQFIPVSSCFCQFLVFFSVFFWNLLSGFAAFCLNMKSFLFILPPGYQICVCTWVLLPCQIIQNFAFKTG